MSDYSGRTLGGRYRLERQLGAGGMGVVYQAWQDDLGRRVAVKLMSAASAEALQRFRREAQAAASLGHPHIIQVFDFQAPDGEPAFIVMELVDGPSLRTLVKSGGPLPEERAARLGIQVLSALDAAHRAGILHRDIKPANVVVSSSPTLGEVAKVLDFGIAKLTAEAGPALTQDGDVLGTALYMSPEQARGAQLDGRSDVYSVAATLFFACTGENALDTRGLEHKLRAVIEGRVRRLADVRPGLDPAFCAIIERGLAADPNARFASAQEMGRALEQWRDRAVAAPPQQAAETAVFSRADQPPQGSPGTRLARTAAPPRRGKSWAALGLGAFAVIAVAGVVLLAGAAGGYYYFFVHAESAAEQAGSGSSGSAIVPASGAPSVGEPAAAATGTAPTREARRSGKEAAAQSGATPPPAPLPATATGSTPGPAPTLSPQVAGGIGSPCKQSSDCVDMATCEGGKCTCQGNMCGSECVNVSRDLRHCGGCNHACNPGEFCMASNCTTCNTTVMRVCNGVCTVLLSNNKHCGGCGVQCPPGKICMSGSCK